MQEARGIEQRQQQRPHRGGKPNRTSLSAAAAAFPVSLLPLVLLVGAASAIGPALPDGYRVLHANVILRHGERTRLQKFTGAGEFGDNDDVVLTAKGEQACYDLGAQLRERYMPLPSATANETLAAGITTKIDGLTLWYDPDRVQIESSGYDRTVESATAVAFGLYPIGQTNEDLAKETLLEDNQIVFPVHSSKPDNDPYILGFDKCPIYNQNWIEAYRADWFMQLQGQATAAQGDNGEVDDYVTQIFNLFQVWAGGNENKPVCYEEAKEFFQHKLEEHAPYNLWDCARSAEQEGDTTAVDIIMEASLPPEGVQEFGPGNLQGFHYLESLVNMIEQQKYEQAITKRMAGGLYVTAMHKRMSEVVEHERSASEEIGETGRLPGMHITAGHYGTLKGVAGALDIGGLYGIPDFSSHMTFELLYNSNAAAIGEDPFAVRILYQEGTLTSNLNFQQMGVPFDASSTAQLDDALLASTRDEVNGIMPWQQWEYLVNIQVEGGPAIYTAEDPEEEWCMECEATEPSACLRVELRLVTEKWEEAEILTNQAVEDKEAVDDGVGSTHVALLSIFGLILGIGVGTCIKPCVDRHNNKIKTSSRAVAGDRGLEAWSSSANSTNGSFRLGAKNPPTRHVMGAVDAGHMVPVPTADYEDSAGAGMNGGTPYANGNGNHYDAEEDAGGSRIPEFAPTSALGEPVPFPHRRQQSGMVTGVDSSMMTGIDAEDDGEDDVMGATNSRAGQEEAGSPTTSSATTKKMEDGTTPTPPSAQDPKDEAEQPDAGIEVGKAAPTTPTV